MIKLSILSLVVFPGVLFAASDLVTTILAPSKLLHPILSPDNGYVAGLVDNVTRAEVQVYSVLHHKQVGRVPVFRPSGWDKHQLGLATQFIFAPNSSELVVSDATGVIGIYDVKGGMKVPPRISRQKGIVTSLAVAPTCGRDPFLLSVNAVESVVWNLVSGQLVLHVPHPVGLQYLNGEFPLWTGTLKPDGTLLALVRRDGLVRVFNLQTKHEVGANGLGHFFQRVDPLVEQYQPIKSPVERPFAVAYFGSSLLITEADPRSSGWNFQHALRIVDNVGQTIDLAPLPKILPFGHHQDHFSADGSRLLLVHDNVTTLGQGNPSNVCPQLVSALTPHSSRDVADHLFGVDSGSISPDGTRIVTVNAAGEIYIWRVL